MKLNGVLLRPYMPLIHYLKECHITRIVIYHVTELVIHVTHTKTCRVASRSIVACYQQLNEWLTVPSAKAAMRMLKNVIIMSPTSMLPFSTSVVPNQKERPYMPNIEKYSNPMLNPDTRPFLIPTVLASPRLLVYLNANRFQA